MIKKNRNINYKRIKHVFNLNFRRENKICFYPNFDVIEFISYRHVRCLNYLTYFSSNIGLKYRLTHQKN